MASQLLNFLLLGIPVGTLDSEMSTSGKRPDIKKALPGRGRMTATEQEELVESYVHTLRVLDHNGDSTITWNPSNEDEVEIARSAFAAAKGKGYLAYTDVDGGQGEVLKDFDPQAGAIIMAPALAGG